MENVENIQITAEACESQTLKKRINQNSDREIASCRMQTAATNADRQNRGRRCFSPDLSGWKPKWSLSVNDFEHLWFLSSGCKPEVLSSRLVASHRNGSARDSCHSHFENIDGAKDEEEVDKKVGRKRGLSPSRKAKDESVD